MSDDRTIESRKANNDTIDVTVTPSLPSSSSRQRLNSPSYNTQNNSLVVLRKISGRTSESLVYADLDSTIGINVYGSPETEMGRFFSIGKKYSQPGSDSIYVCLGVYSNLSDAQTIHPAFKENNNWNKLSLEQTLKLGKENWYEVSN